MKNNQRGSALILELLVVLSITLTFMAMSAISSQKIIAQNNTVAALSVVRAINASEGWHWRIYSDGYRTPQVLANLNAGAIGAPAQQSCETPGLLGGNYAAIIQLGQSNGYSFSFTGSGAAPLASGCAIAGYTGYKITANPINPATGNMFLYSDQTGVVRYDTTGPASASSLAWTN